MPTQYTDEKIEVNNPQEVLNFKRCATCGDELDNQWRCKACKIQYLFIGKNKKYENV